MNKQLTLPIDEHTYLRKTHTGDAEETFALVEKNRAHLRQWMAWVDASQSVDDFNKHLLEEEEKTGDNWDFVIIHRNHIVGRIGFHPIDTENRKGSLGYWLDKDHQGQGIMTNAVQALLTHAFTTLNLNRMEIRAAVGNKPSRAIPERLGFRYEGAARDAEWLYDHFVDLAVYSKLHGE